VLNSSDEWNVDARWLIPSFTVTDQPRWSRLPEGDPPSTARTARHVFNSLTIIYLSYYMTNDASLAPACHAAAHRHGSTLSSGPFKTKTPGWPGVFVFLEQNLSERAKPALLRRF